MHILLNKRTREGGSNIKNIMQLERSTHNSSRRSMSPIMYIYFGNTIENEYVKFHGISERKEQYDDIRNVGNFKIKYRNREF